MKRLVMATSFAAFLIGIFGCHAPRSKALDTKRSVVVVSSPSPRPVPRPAGSNNSSSAKSTTEVASDAGMVIHTVAPGESFNKISKYYNIKEDAILAVNPGLERNRLRVNQRIRIPISAKDKDAFDHVHRKALGAYKRGDYECAVSLWNAILPPLQVDQTELRYKVAFNTALAYVDWWKVCQTKDPGAALDKLREALDYLREAEKVDATHLSIRQEMLNSVSKLRESIVDTYRKGAEQGRADAQYNLGVCYANGEGVSKDNAEAVKLYRKAAEQGNVKAREALREMGEESSHHVAPSPLQLKVGEGNGANKELHSQYYMAMPLGTVRGMGTIISSPGNFIWCVGKTFMLAKHDKGLYVIGVPFAFTAGAFFCTIDVGMGVCDIGTLGWFGNELYTGEADKMFKKPWFWERPLKDNHLGILGD